MNLVLLTEILIKPLLINKDNLIIREINEDDYITIQVLVDECDFGAVIGKNGKNANAIRTIIQASGYIHNHLKIKVNFDKN